MSKIRNIKILILEDDLETVERILSVLRQIEDDKQVSFGVTVLPDYIQVNEYINKNPQIKFDALLLDRDCYLGGSFHTVNLDNFDKDKIISISSVPEYNNQAKRMGINKIVWKDYSNLNQFSSSLKQLLLQVM